MNALWGIISPVLELATILVKKFFPSAEERKRIRQEKAKEKWDAFINNEKEVREKLYPPDHHNRRS